MKKENIKIICINSKVIFSVIKQFQGANYIFSGSTRNTVREIDYTIPKDDNNDNDDTYDDGDDDDEYK